MDPARRTAAGVGAFAALELALGAYVLSAVGSARIGLFIIVCAVATGVLAIALDRLLRPSPEPPSGGGGTSPGVGPIDPSWWPDFERDLAAYMESRRPRGPAAPTR